MNAIVTVRSQLWVKILILIGIPLLGWAGIYTVWLSIASGINISIESIFLCGAGLFSIIAVLKGLPLILFLQHHLIMYSDGIEITNGRQSKIYKWNDIGRIKASDTFNVLRIYDRNLKLIYAVDYYAENFGIFAAHLNAGSNQQS